MRIALERFDRPRRIPSNAEHECELAPNAGGARLLITAEHYGTFVIWQPRLAAVTENAALSCV